MIGLSDRTGRRPARGPVISITVATRVRRPLWSAERAAWGDALVDEVRQLLAFTDRRPS
jgi:hypothetical protein